MPDLPSPSAHEPRIDPLGGEPTVIVASRQSRPNLPPDECPFCPGGLEAPNDYDVRWFPNRWPPLPEGRAEVVLYTPDHNATFHSLGVAGARRVVDLWAERTEVLSRRPEVAYVLIFENRGPQVGATIAHPHGQIYAYDRVPPKPAAELSAGNPDAVGPGAAGAEGERLVSQVGGWQSWVPHAAQWPFELVVAPLDHIDDLPSLDGDGRHDLAGVLVETLGRLDGLFDAPMPYMLWFHQRPFDGGQWPAMRVHAHIVPLWRDHNVQRFVAAAELGAGIYFNPVDPVDAARRLRDVAFQGQ